MDFIPDLYTITSSIEAAFQLIFPEYPAVGLVVCGLAAILLVYYLIKADIKHALKISLSSFCVMLFILYALHSFNRLIFAVT